MELPDPDRMKRQFLEATSPPPQNEYSNEFSESHKASGEADYEEASPAESDVDAKMTQELDGFYKKLIYGLPGTSKHSDHTNHLSKPRKKDLINTYQHKDILRPEGRRKRVKRRVTEMTAMTTEQLELYLKNLNTKKKDEEIRLQKRQRIYRKMLQKYEDQTRERILDDLFHKFAKYISNRAVKHEGITEIYPANVQRLIDCIDHNICETCKIAPDERKANCSLYKSIANCIGWLIVEVLYDAQTKNMTREPHDEADNAFEPCPVGQQLSPVQNAMMKRAMIALNKKEKNASKRKELRLGALPKDDQILELSKILGYR